MSKGWFNDRNRHALARKGIRTGYHEKMEFYKLLKFKKANIPDEDFNWKQLQAGIKVEKEHTNDENIAKAIAKAHLSEDKDYYRKLKKAGL